MYIAAQVLIAISSVLYGVSCFAKNKKILFVVQIFSSAFYCLHCFFMSAIVGGIVSIFDLLRVVVFYILEKVNGTKKQKIVSASMLFVLAIICSIFNWQGRQSLLPFMATLIFIISLVVSRLLFIKCATFISSTCSVAYLYLSGSNFGALMELIPAILGAIGIGIAIVNLVKVKKNGVADK